MLKSIVLLYSLINVGDISHGNALVEKLKQDNQVLSEIIVIDANLPKAELQSGYKRVVSKLNPHNSMILAVGEKGLLALSTLKAAKLLYGSNGYIGASVHQYFDVIEDLKRHLSFLAIPEAALDSEAKKAVIRSLPYTVLTLAVPAINPTIDQLKAAYDNWDINPSNKPPINNSYIVVMLPGDAPDQNGQIKSFTKESVKKLFDNIVALRSKYRDKYTVVVQNGPRTGKFNPQNGEIICAHEYEKGKDSATAIDGISQYFVSLLEQHSIPHYFFNFAFEIDGKNKKGLSVFNQLLYVAQMKQDNYFIVPGESISMLSQIPLYFEPGRVVVFKPDSMNASHNAIFHVIKNRGNISYFSDEQHVVVPEHPVKMKNDDTATIVNGIIDIFRN